MATATLNTKSAKAIPAAGFKKESTTKSRRTSRWTAGQVVRGIVSSFHLAFYGLWSLSIVFILPIMAFFLLPWLMVAPLFVVGGLLEVATQFLKAFGLV